MRGRFHLALLLLLGLLAPRAASALQPGKRIEQYAHSAWPSVAHASTVSAIRQSRAGHLWVGTSDGLVRFDGQQVSTIDLARPREGRTPGSVRKLEALLEARDGGLWIASAGQGLARLGQHTRDAWGEGAPGTYVYGLAEDAAGTVWAAGREGIARFPVARDRALPGIPSNEGLPRRCAHAMAVTGKGGDEVLWAGTHGGLARWNGSRWVPEAGALGNVIVDVLLGEADGTLWVGTRGAGLWQRRAGQWRSFTAHAGLGSNDVSAILRDRDGHLWVATTGGHRGSLAWLAEERFVPFALGPRMCGDRIEALAEDDEGGLWIGTEVCGLHRLADRIVSSLTTEDGLPSDRLLGLRADGAGGALVGTRGGGMARVHAGGTRGWQVAPLTCAAGLPCDECWDFAPLSPPGTGETMRSFQFLAVCRQNVVLRWDGQNMVRETLPGGLHAASFALEARDGARWFAFEKTVVRAAGDTTTTLPELPFEGYRVLFETRAGAMVIAAEDGLALWRPGTPLQVLPLPPLERPAEVANFHEDADGTLWMATKGQGIRRLEGERMSTISVAQGLPSGWVVMLLADDQDRLWASSSRGIFSVPKRELKEVADGKRPRVHPSVYDGNDGIHMRAEPYGHPAGFKDERGRLWFATSNGLVIVDPRVAVTAPRVTITEVRLGGVRLDLHSDAAPVVRGAAVDLTASFAASSFAAEGNTLFRYRLSSEGDDGAFVELGPSRTFSQAGLEPGDYQLVVEARSRDGHWRGNVTRLSFSLVPPVHRSPAFLGLMALALALVLAAVHRARLAHTRAGLEAVMAERARIAREVHDTLAQAFVATSVQLECLEEALEGDPTGAGPKIRRHLGTAKKVVEESLEEARSAVWVLRPQAIESGLVPALQTLVDRVSGGTAVELEVTGAVRTLSPLVASNLLRIAQEAVANAHRHARARRILLRLAFAPASVTLSVTDDGRGISAAPKVDAAQAPGQGLLGMKERAAQINGRLSIVDRPPAPGTTVSIEVAA